MKLSFFNSVKSQQCQQVTIDELMQIADQHTKQICKGIRDFTELGNDEEARKLKASLPVVVVSRLFDNGAPRKKDTGEPTGIVMMDYDNCKDHVEAMALALKVIKIYQMALQDGTPLAQHLIAVHLSPMHGIHIWFRWIYFCHSVEECQEKMAEWLGMDDYDKACKDNSRCSFLVPSDYFIYLNKDFINENEEYATLQKNLENNEKIESKKNTSSAGNDRTHSSNGKESSQGSALRNAEGSDLDDKPVSEKEISSGRKAFQILLKRAKLNKILDRENHDESGHTNHNVLLSLLSMGLAKLVRKAALLKVLEKEMPNSWSDEMARQNLTQLVKDFYENYHSSSRPFSKEMRETFLAINKEEGEDEGKENAEDDAALEDMQEECLKELESVESSIKKYVEVPAELPPIFKECVATLHTPWKPAGIVALLPMLGTICSKARGRYSLDGRLHSPTFMTVVEAPAASGKSQIMDFGKIVFERFSEENLSATTQLNLYNAEVVKANGAKEIKIDMPDVCLRSIDGKFTEAGLDKVMNFYHELHMWLGASEIDEVKDNWTTFSYILRKVFDNDGWGRTQQSTKTFVGTRPLYLNILLLGTPRAIKRCYNDPEDGLVHRTIFFKLMYDLPLAKRISMPEATKRRIMSLCNRIHDKYCVRHDVETDGKMVIAEETEFNMTSVDKWLEEWLKEKYAESVSTAQLSIDTFRRRAAVIAHRAGIVCKAIYGEVNKGKPMSKAQTKVMKDFVLWVAEFVLNMAVYKYGDELDNILTESMEVKASKHDHILDKLPQQFTIAEAYRIFKGQKPTSVRSMLMRLVNFKLLENPRRGVYQKVKS